MKIPETDDIIVTRECDDRFLRRGSAQNVLYYLLDVISAESIRIWNIRV
jgi:hypothetical protein